MAKKFLPYDLDQQILLRPNIRDWLPENHLAHFILDVVASLDLSAIYKVYDQKDNRGRLAFNPSMMVSLLVYGYCVGKFSSRKIERATYDEVAFRVLSADQHPDHDSIAAFRKQHLATLGGLFVQILQLCQKAGLVKLGHISVDGSKIQANASKHKAMSYARMNEAEQRLNQEIMDLLQKAQEIDAKEDAEYGKGVHGNELPAELARRESRLAKIKEAKAALEAEAEAARQKAEADEPKKSSSGPALPAPKAQKNFTDPESRIMPDSSHKGSFVQGYNVQIAVDDEAQIIIATNTTQQANDKQQLVPVSEKVIKNCGRLADVTSADSGYFSEAAVGDATFTSTNLLVPPGREKKTVALKAQADEKSAPVKMSATTAMRTKLSDPKNSGLYRMRKAIVEPVFGQIKEIRGFRRFSMRGLVSARHEFDFVAATHNLLKLFRSGKAPCAA